MSVIERNRASIRETIQFLKERLKQIPSPVCESDLYKILSGDGDRLTAAEVLACRMVMQSLEKQPS